MKQFLFLFFYIESIATSRLNIVTMIKHKNKNMIQNDIIKHYCYKKLTPLSQKHTKMKINQQNFTFKIFLRLNPSTF